MNKELLALASTQESERIHAAQDIAESNNPELAAPLIEQLVKEQSQLVKDSIVFSLQKMPCHLIYEQLFQLFLSADAFLRNAVVSIFGSEKHEVIGFLTAHLDHANREVRKLILDALYATGTMEAVMALRAGLHDPSINVKITAAEYIGMLEDQDSREDLLQLLRENPEPMLRCTILESLSRIGSTGLIDQVMAILGSESDINRLDPVYIPGIIMLASRSGDLDFICLIFETIANFNTYADDIMRAVGESRRRFKRIMDECCIMEMVTAIAGNKALRDEVRYAAVELLLTEENGNIPKNILYELGMELIRENSMLYVGVRLLSLSGYPQGRQLINNILNNTKDQELRALCEELQSQHSGKNLAE